jgi:hypothetical protein
MTLFRKRDIVVFIVILITAFISYDNRRVSYSFEPAWYLDMRDFHGINIHKDAAPLITDLNGDGEKEMVVITPDSYLKVNILSKFR